MISKKEIIEMLSLSKDSEIESLFQKAYQVKIDNVGNKVYYRGIIEISNLCIKSCYYCGIRKDNDKVERYEMTEQEIIDSALWAYHNQYGSIVLQSGERTDAKYIDKISCLLKKIKKETEGKLGITLSLGEQTRDTYQKWFDEGAHRYLLRIETSNEDLYKQYHPDKHSYNNRLDCLKVMQEIGYQVGTGVMIGLPNQKVEHLADDIMFFKDMDIDMIGMGPYVIHKDTPMAIGFTNYNPQQNLLMALKMIASTRITLKDVNIASTTALQALAAQGREMGLKAGANIIMPVITEITYRGNYQLYDGKPCLDENASQCRGCLQRRIDSIGEHIGYNEWGDSPHFKKKRNN